MIHILLLTLVSTQTSGEEGNARRKAALFLKEANEVWENVTALKIVGRMFLKDTPHSTTDFVLTLKRPRMARVEAKKKLMGMSMDHVWVLNQDAVMLHFKRTNEYTLITDEPLGRIMGETGLAAWLFFEKKLVNLDKVQDGSKDVSVSEVEVGKEKMWKLALGKPGGVGLTFWLDKDKQVRRYEWRGSGGGKTPALMFEYSRIIHDPKIPAGAFTFTVPKDAKKMKIPDPKK